MFVDYKTFAGLLGRHFVGNRFVAIQDNLLNFHRKPVYH